MKTMIERRFSLQDRSGTVLVNKGEIWTLGEKTRSIVQNKEQGQKEISAVSSPLSVSAQEASLSWDGNRLLLADRFSRKISQIDPENGKEDILVEPDSLTFGDYDTALLDSDAVIGDIAWYNGLLYLAVQAGYSSAIYGIDLGNKSIVSHRLAPGPKPSGLDFNPKDGSMYTIDTRNRELRRFLVSGEESIADLPDEWVEPRGLSYESEKRLWSTDWSNGDVVRIRLED